MTETASRQDLIDYVASDLGLSKTAAKATVESVIAGIEQITFERGSLSIREFGKFTARKRAPRTVMSGVLAHAVQVPARTALVFTCSKNLVRV